MEEPLKPYNVGLARKYFWGGFLFLPFLWLMNYCYFKEILTKPNGNHNIKWYARWSLYLFCASMAALFCWMVTFWVINDDSWPDFAFASRHTSENL